MIKQKGLSKEGPFLRHNDLDEIHANGCEL